MHEMALSEDIVRTCREAVGPDAEQITAIAVDVGALSAVNVDTLDFCLGMVLEQSGMGSPRVQITLVPAKMRCACGCVYTANDMFAGCPQCDGFAREILEGKDVTVRYVEVDDEQG